MTFVEAWEKYAAGKVQEFSTEKYREQWRRTVERHALPELGGIPVQDIGLPDVLRVLSPIWGEKTVTAAKLRERVEKVLACPMMIWSAF